MYPATYAAAAMARGIPMTVIEIGGGYHDQQEHVRNGVRGVLNMLRHAGALGGRGRAACRPAAPARDQGDAPAARRAVRADANARPADWIDGGDTLADIVSPHTFETLETMIAPFERSVVVLTRNYATRIHPGDYAS